MGGSSHNKWPKELYAVAIRELCEELETLKAKGLTKTRAVKNRLSEDEHAHVDDFIKTLLSGILKNIRGKLGSLR